MVDRTDAVQPRTNSEVAFDEAARALLQGTGAELYADAVAEGLATDDPRLAEGAEDRPAFDLLIELGLLQLDPTDGRYVARDPLVSQASIVTPLSQRGAELISASSEWAGAFGALVQSWRRSPIAPSGPVMVLHGVPAITKFLQDSLAEATTEVLTAQPQAIREASRLDAVASAENEALRRGVRIRTLYQHSARRHAATHKYVRAVTENGAEVRTLDEFFNRMLVFDRSHAVIPGQGGRESAVIIREPSIVAFLVDIFERAWERARPFGNRESSTMRDIAREQRAMTIRMLIQGYADPLSSKRLGVSPRTYAGYVADLKEEYDAETRFQLGYFMGQRGITGEDPFGEDNS